MRAKLFLTLALLVIASMILPSCAAPTPQVVEKEVVKEVAKEVVVTQQVEVVKERPKLTMWVDHFFFVKGAEAMLKANVLEWAQLNGFDIEFIQDSYEVMRPREDAALESKSLPDVVYTDLSMLAKIRRAGQASDLTDVVAMLNENMGGFTAGPLAGVTADGKQWGIPFMASTEEFYVRKDLLEKAGVAYPETWEDLYTVAKAINDPPTVWAWGPQVSNKAFDAERHLTAMIWAYGGSVFAEDGKTVAIDSQATRDVLGLLKQAWDEDLIPKEALTWDDSGNNKIYQTGKAAIIENTGSVVTWMKDNDPDLLKATQLGMPPAGPEGRFVQGDGWVLVVPNTGQNVDAAKDLVAYLSDPTRYESLIEVMGGLRIPVYAGLGEMALWQDPALKPLADAIPFTFMPGYPGPVSDNALEAFNRKVVATMVTRVLSDNWDADRAIAEAVQTLNTIVEATGS